MKLFLGLLLAEICVCVRTYVQHAGCMRRKQGHHLPSSIRLLAPSFWLKSGKLGREPPSSCHVIRALLNIASSIPCPTSHRLQLLLRMRACTAWTQQCCHEVYYFVPLYLCTSLLQLSLLILHSALSSLPRNRSVGVSLS
ncbi:hypothetical protein B0F90DRAFT_1713142, partial [Multifurca ochricompacta]